MSLSKLNQTQKIYQPPHNLHINHNHINRAPYKDQNSQSPQVKNINYLNHNQQIPIQNQIQLIQHPQYPQFPQQIQHTQYPQHTQHPQNTQQTQYHQQLQQSPSQYQVIHSSPNSNKIFTQIHQNPQNYQLPQSYVVNSGQKSIDLRSNLPRQVIIGENLSRSINNVGNNTIAPIMSESNISNINRVNNHIMKQ
jgi:hypothetical protein